MRKPQDTGPSARSRQAPATQAAIGFQSRAGWCAGWYHVPEGPARDMAIVLCRPLAYEALCSHAMYAQLARALAASGFAVVLFDYHGTGDSAGEAHGPHRVDAWLDSVDAAIDEALRLSGASRVGLLGMRVGALLAAQVATRRGGVDSLVMWAPCLSGRAYAREMKAAHASRMVNAGSTPEGDAEALGMHFTAQTLEDLKQLDPAKLTAAPARRALVIARDDMPGEGPWPARLRELGADTDFRDIAGYSRVMAEPTQPLHEPEMLAAIRGWFAASRDEAAPAKTQTAMPARNPVQLGNVIERPLFFGPRNRLFGVLAEPAQEHARARCALLLLNVGGNHHIGANRLWVKTAREFAAAGHTVLRMDVSGIGDSPGDFPHTGPMWQRCVPDVSAAIDALIARGCERFWLVGICSGSFLALETALADPRVHGQVLVNTRTLDTEPAGRSPWHASMQRHYKSARYYLRALGRTDVYLRLLRGRVDVRGIASRLAMLAGARVHRATARLFGQGAPQEGVLAKFVRLSGRGVETLIVMSEQDDGLDYLEFHLGHRASRMRGHEGFRLVLLPNCDHTFSTVANQRVLLDLLREHFDADAADAESETMLEPRVVTT